MAWRANIADILNQWAEMGIFEYAIPFLLLFAVVYAILEKSKILGENKGVNAIVGASVGLLALMNDLVSTFFAEIFPRLGIFLAVLLVLVILVGMAGEDAQAKKLYFVVGIVLAAATILWAFANWNFWGDQFGIGWWVGENFWLILAGILVVLGVVAVIFGKGGSGGGSKPK
jgi:hypothetical protein